MLIQSPEVLGRIVNAALWLIVVVRFAPATWRTFWRKRMRPNDPLLATAFFTGIVMLGGALWWWIGSGNGAGLAGIYALCCLLAIYSLVVGRAYDHG